MNSEREQYDNASFEAYFEQYANLTNKTSAWFIAYGAGFLGLALSNDGLLQLIRESSYGFSIFGLIMTGAAAQALRALIYKWVIFVQLRSEMEPILSAKILHRLCLWLIESAWFDLLFDVVTLVVYTIGTYLALSLLF